MKHPPRSLPIGASREQLAGPGARGRFEVKEGRPRRAESSASSKLADKRSSWEVPLGTGVRRDLQAISCSKINVMLFRSYTHMHHFLVFLHEAVGHFHCRSFLQWDLGTESFSVAMLSDSLRGVPLMCRTHHQIDVLGLNFQHVLSSLNRLEGSCLKVSGSALQPRLLRVWRPGGSLPLPSPPASRAFPSFPAAGGTGQCGLSAGGWEAAESSTWTGHRWTGRWGTCPTWLPSSDAPPAWCCPPTRRWAAAWAAAWPPGLLGQGTPLGSSCR